MLYLKLLKILKMIEKNDILQLITEEKDIYSRYLSICKIYNVQPDTIAVAKHEAILECLNKILNNLGKK